ncbi:MAG: gliding motility-associated ABC transporter substrate-binding protein GldG [Bacteroidetes bacterium]|nr:gliding motility-associated ABC transporter substrate-binding protein GldG [Bacteroidota bacterium]
MIGILIALNVLSSSYFTRVDLTADRRYTLTDSTKALLRNLKDVVFVKVYLKGDFPAGFQRLATSTKEMLDEFKVYGGEKIQYEFNDVITGKSEKELRDVVKEMSQKGLAPTNVQNRGGDEYSQQIVIPGALVTFGSREAPVNLLENTPGTGAQTALNNSIAHLEYNLTRSIRQLTQITKPRIGIIRGHGEMEDERLVDFLSSMADFYDPQFITLSDVVSIPDNIRTILIIRPQQTFSDKDKFKIDQYVMNGGTVLWLVDALNAGMDSVVAKRSFIALDYPLNLDDQLFRYGARINPDLLLDLQCNPVPLLTSMEGQQPKFTLFPCFYFPVLTPVGSHPIVRNIDAVATQFAGTIDTVALSSVKKIPLLVSSKNSRIVFTPWMVDFRDLRNRPNENEYRAKQQMGAVLLEGVFPSLFQNRLTPEMQAVLQDSLKQPFKAQSAPTKMIVISDGDMAANEFNAQGQPLALGFYRYTGEYFGNKTFLMNCVDYLAGFPELINTRSKTIMLRLLDEAKVKAGRTTWMWINLAAPIGALLLFGLVFNVIRYQKFALRKQRP